MKTKLATALLFLAMVVPFIPATARATDTKISETSVLREVVVTATKIETPTEEVGSSISVVTEKEIREKQKPTVYDVLRNIPALDVVKSGGPGGNVAVFIRGAASDHTLVLIDGVEMNDPGTSGRGFNMGNLTTDNIERIEILRGAQSVLYGSDAMGGVINIITKRGKGKPGGHVSFEGGSYNTLNGSAGVSGGNDLINYSVGMSRQDTDGISAANKAAGNTENDGYENTTLSGKIGVTPTDIFETDLTVRYVDVAGDLDNFGGAGGDDPNYTSDTRKLFARTQGRLFLFDEFWEQALGVSYTVHDRGLTNSVDADHPASSAKGQYNGGMLKFDWQHNLYFEKIHTLTFGVETEDESADSDYRSRSAYGPFANVFKEQTARTTGYYVQDGIRLGDVSFTTLGIRLDDHDRFGTETTWRAASSYLFTKTGTRVKGSYGTGFKAPSLFQLYSQYGDVNLNPEKTKSWDVGIEQKLAQDRMTLSATYFNNEFENLIDFDSQNSIYINTAEAATKGVEASAAISPMTDITLKLAYTYTDTEDKKTGEALVRRPRHKLGFDANYRLLDNKLNTNLGVRYIGKRDANDFSTFPAGRVKMDGYTVVNFAAAFDITKNIQLAGRVDNLFDEEYEEVLGYGTPGISAYAGVKFRF